jgi:hypothetical protein
MNDLERLVPDIKLCKKIPEGKFADSALVWQARTDAIELEWIVVPREQAEPMMRRIPAPTLAEISEALENHGSVFTRRDDDGWMVMLEMAGDDEGYGYDAKIERDPANPATAAMKLWLEFKGVE